MSDSDFKPLYPQIHVPLVGQDGNAFFIIGRVRDALRRGGVDADKITEFTEDAYSGNYDHVLQTVMRWVSVS